jgi:hypothetical protein
VTRGTYACGGSDGAGDDGFAGQAATESRQENGTSVAPTSSGARPHLHRDGKKSLKAIILQVYRDFFNSETDTAEAEKAQVLGLDGLERPQGTLGYLLHRRRHSLEPATPRPASATPAHGGMAAHR